MTISEAREKLAFWRNVLNLPEWTIAIAWGSKREMGDAVGTCVWSPEEMVADIRLARRQDNPEQTIIHELIHVVLDGHKAMNGKYNEMQERAINRLADALLSLR